jgi:hypothetical protein
MATPRVIPAKAGIQRAASLCNFKPIPDGEMDPGLRRDDQDAWAPWQDLNPSKLKGEAPDKVQSRRPSKSY